jgi:hypothetical protein
MESILVTDTPSQTVTSEVKPPVTSSDTSAASQSGASLPPKLCACGCGKPVPGPNFTCATVACRQRVKRQRDREAKGLNNDTKTGAGNSIKNFLGEKINSARHRIAQAFEPKIVGPNGTVETVQGSAVALGATAGTKDRGAAFRKLCKAGVKTLDKIGKWFVRERAKKKGASEQFIERELLPQVGSEEDRDNLAEALDDYLRSINYVPEKPEFVALMIASVNYGSGFVTALKLINDLPDKKVEENEKEQMHKTILDLQKRLSEMQKAA